MRHITSLDEANLSQASVVTIGAFDGVHRGHRHLIGQLIHHARLTGLIPVVLTFFPHPKMVLHGFRPGFYLTLPDAKAALLSELGVKLVITHPFDDAIRQIRAADFVDGLIRSLNMAELWVGPDFALGYKREGDVAFLRRQAELKGFELRVVDLMDVAGERISSSRVREALAKGDVAEAARLLGRWYVVPGEVTHGVQRGRTIGFPTANLKVRVEQAIPARGVYSGWAEFAGQRKLAVINIGSRPTFDGASNMVIEAHVLDFSGDLYGQQMALHFAARLRDEQRFGGVEALVAQIEADITLTRKLLGEASPHLSSLPQGS